MLSKEVLCEARECCVKKGRVCVEQESFVSSKDVLWEARKCLYEAMKYCVKQ